MTDTTDDLAAMLATRWPLDGPYDAERTVTAAGTIHELIRRLNDISRHRAAVPYASTAAVVLNGLSAALGDVPQLAEQLGTRVAEFANNPHAYVYSNTVRITDRAAVNTAVVNLRDQLTAVADLAVTLSRALDTAHTLANRIGVDKPDEETGPPLTAALLQQALDRAGVDHTQLDITNRPAVWGDVDAGTVRGSVHIAGPKPIRRAARDVLLDLGLSLAPCGDHDEWSGSLTPTAREQDR